MKKEPEKYYLIIDQVYDCVLWSTPSIDTANAMSMSSTRIRIVPSVTKIETLAEMSASDFRDFTKCYRVAYRWADKSPPELIEQAPELLEYREEVKRRSKAHGKLINFCDKALELTADSKRFVSYADTVLFELSQCDDAAGSYSEGIKTYASMIGVEPGAAYQELNMQMENLAHARMRNLGIYIRYRTLLNDALGDQASLDAVIEQARGDLTTNSRV